MSFVSHARFLPPPPRPPHDPRRIPLDAVSGWREAELERVEVEPTTGALLLLRTPAASPVLGESSGSFGGLVPPKNVAIAPDGGILLLDRDSGTLRRFDGCVCAFEEVPCTAGIGGGPRELGAAGGLAVRGSDLLIADPGKAHVAVFSLYGYALRGFWAPPPGAMASAWSPVDVAVYRNVALVGDPNNGCVHRFARSGAWIDCFPGLGAIESVAVDLHGRLYVAVADDEVVRVVDLATGERLADQRDPRAVAGDFCDLPFAFDPAGVLDLACLCTDPGKPSCFDLAGHPVDCAAPASLRRFERTGSYVSTPLDSRLHRCAWDRVDLELDLPAGTSVVVRSHTAEVPLADQQIHDLPPDAWETAQQVSAETISAGRWDCLLRSPPGRYLWLRLQLTGDGYASPEVRSALIDFPRISLRRYLPGIFGEEPASADFTDRLLAIFDRGFRDIESLSDRSAEFYDPLSAPTGRRNGDFLAWLASWVGVTLDGHLPEAQRRGILDRVGELFRWRGTEHGLRETLNLYLGLDQRSCAERPHCGPCGEPLPMPWKPPPLILEHFKLRRWLALGRGRLGDEAVLWGQSIANRTQLSGPVIAGNAQLGVTELKTYQDPLRDPFHIHAHRFTVFLPAWIGRRPERKRSVKRLIAAEKPAHTAAEIRWVEPRFRVGIQSMIGFDAVIGCYPQGIEVGKALLGRAMVLPEAGRGDSPMRVGTKARVGATTRL